MGEQEMINNLIILLTGTVLGVLSSIFLALSRRSFMPLLELRMEAVESDGPSRVIRLTLEAENKSAVSLRRTDADLKIIEFSLPAPSNFHADRFPSEVKDDAEDELTNLQKSIKVLGTKKLEPREIEHSEVLYRWGDAPLIFCRLTFAYSSWLGLLYGKPKDRKSVRKWFVNPKANEADVKKPGGLP